MRALPRRMTVGRTLAACLVGAAIGACEEGTAPLSLPRPATIEQVTGPWQREPLVLDPALVGRVDEACKRGAPPEVPPGLTIALIDARGAGRLLVRQTNGASEAAYESTISAGGHVTCQIMMNGASIPSAEPGEVTISGGTGVDHPAGEAWYSYFGQAGPGVTRVVIDVTGVGPLTASLGGDGSYWGWWPVRQGGRFTVTISGYDSSGGLVDRVTSP